MTALAASFDVAALVQRLREHGPDLLPKTAELAVARAAEALSLVAPFSPQQAEAIFERIVVMGGPAEGAARLSRARGALGAGQTGHGRGSFPSLAAASVATAVVSRGDLAALLAPSLGLEASESLVLKFSERVGFPVKGDRDAALKVLEAMAREPGVVGVAARFAKVKLILT